MKRAIVILFSLSLIALPSFAGAAGTHKATSARCMSLEHISGSWRMEIECGQTKGAILLIDAGRDVRYSGQGMFRDWSQSELSALYQSLVPKADSNFVLMQLG
jgi:hypothetical protein